MKIICLLLISVCSIYAYGQPKYTLSGYVRDSLSGETLIGASLAINGQSRGVASNSYGFYSITLPTGVYRITCSYVGYQSREVEIRLQNSQSLSFLLPPFVSTSEEVIISSRRRDANVKNAQMGKIDLSISQIKSVPAFLGEVDIPKTLQLLPGVRNAGEGNTGFYVRGGGPDHHRDDGAVPDAALGLEPGPRVQRSQRGGTCRSRAG